MTTCPGLCPVGWICNRRQETDVKTKLGNGWFEGKIQQTKETRTVVYNICIPFFLSHDRNEPGEMVFKEPDSEYEIIEILPADPNADPDFMSFQAAAMVSVHH